MAEYLETAEERIGPYVIVNLICRGVAGDVYRALDTQLNRYVAIKRIPPQLMNDPQLIELMEQAAQQLQRIDHVNVVRILEVSREANDQPYFVMEYVEGPSFYELIKNKTALPASIICELLLQACQGLAWAYARGIVHGDIKPTHLLVSSSGPLKLAGFRMIQLLRETGTLPFNDPGNEQYLYLSPEQLKGARADLRTDIYSLGAVFFHLLGGQKYTSYSPLLIQLRPELPERFCTLIQSMTAEDPKMRPANYEVLLAELDEVRQLCLHQEGAHYSMEDSDPYAGNAHGGGESYLDHGMSGAADSYAQANQYDANYQPGYDAGQPADTQGAYYPEGGDNYAAAPYPEHVQGQNHAYNPAEQNVPRAIPEAPRVEQKKNPWVMALAGALIFIGLSMLLAKTLRAKTDKDSSESVGHSLFAKLFSKKLTPEELEEQRMENTRENIQIIYASVQEYYSANKSWPSSLNELLGEDQLAPEDLRDGWGGDIDYNYRDQQIQSYGADEMPDTSDDFIFVSGRFTKEPPREIIDDFSEEKYK